MRRAHLALVGLLACSPAPAPQEAPIRQAWRPFSDASPWNTPIPEDAAIHPESAALIEALEASSTRWPGLLINIHPWSVPVYEAGPAFVDVHARLSNEGENVTLRWPVPSEAQPAPEADGHLAIVDRIGARGFDFFQARPRPDGGWDCTLCASIDLRGDGVRPPQGRADPWYAAHGARACGFPLIAGLIREEELRAGRIEHALVIAYPGIRERVFVPPASTGHPANGRISEDRGIPCGGRVQLDPSIDVGALDLSPAARTIARALQVYGAYVGDFSETINLYADGSPEARAGYEGMLTDDALRAIELRRLRVVAQ